MTDDISIDSVASELPQNTFEQRYFYHMLEDEEIWYFNKDCYIHNLKTDQVKAYTCPQIPHTFMYEIDDEVVVYAPQLYNAVMFRHQVYGVLFNKLILLDKAQITELCDIPGLQTSKSDFKIALSDQRLLICNGRQLYQYNPDSQTLVPLNIACSNIYTFCGRTLFLRDGYYFLNSDLSARRLTSDISGTVICADAGLLIRSEGEYFCTIDFTTLDVVRLPKAQLGKIFGGLQQANYHQFCEYNSKGRCLKSEVLVSFFGPKYEDFDNRRDLFSKQDWMENHISTGTGLQAVLNAIQQLYQNQISYQTKMDRQFLENSQRVQQVEQLVTQKLEGGIDNIAENVQLMQFGYQQKFQNLGVQLESFGRDLRKEMQSISGINQVQEQMGEFQNQMSQLIKYQETQMNWLSQTTQSTQEDYIARFASQQRVTDIIQSQIQNMESKFSKQLLHQNEQLDNLSKRQNETADALSYMGGLSKDLSKAESLVNKLSTLEQHIDQSFELQEQKINIKSHMDSVKQVITNLDQRIESSIDNVNQLKNTIKTEIQLFFQQQQEHNTIQQQKGQQQDQIALNVQTILTAFQTYSDLFDQHKNEYKKLQDVTQQQLVDTQKSIKQTIDLLEKPDGIVQSMIPKLQAELNTSQQLQAEKMQQTLMDVKKQISDELLDIKSSTSKESIQSVLRGEIQSFQIQLLQQINQKVDSTNLIVEQKQQQSFQSLKSLETSVQENIQAFNAQLQSFIINQSLIPDKLAQHLNSLVSSNLKQNQEFQEEIQKSLQKFGDLIGTSFGDKLLEFKVQIAQFVEKHAKNYDQILEEMLIPINKTVETCMSEMGNAFNKSLTQIQESLVEQKQGSAELMNNKFSMLATGLSDQIKVQLFDFSQKVIHDVSQFNQSTHSIKEDFASSLQRFSGDALSWKQQLEQTINNFQQESSKFITNNRQEFIQFLSQNAENMASAFQQQDEVLRNQLAGIEQFVLQFSSNSDGFVAQFKDELQRIFDQNVSALIKAEGGVSVHYQQFEELWDQNLQLLARFGGLVSDGINEVLPSHIEKLKQILRSTRLTEAISEAVKVQNQSFIQQVQDILVQKVQDL